MATACIFTDNLDNTIPSPIPISGRGPELPIKGHCDTKLKIIAAGWKKEIYKYRFFQESKPIGSYQSQHSASLEDISTFSNLSHISYLIKLRDTLQNNANGYALQLDLVWSSCLAMNLAVLSVYKKKCLLNTLGEVPTGIIHSPS